MAVGLVVFDVDDTLYLERDYVHSGFTAVGNVLADDHGITGFQEEAWAAFLRGDRGDIFDTTLHALTGKAPRSLVERCIDVYRSHQPTITLLPDADRFITWCVSEFSTAVVSDGPAASQRAKVTALGLQSRFDRIVLTDEMGIGWAKPSQQSFRLLEQELGFPGDECVYLADNPMKDFVGPLELGWKTVRVRRRNGLHEHATSGRDAATVIDDMGNDSLVFLESIFGEVPMFRPAGEGNTS